MKVYEVLEIDMKVNGLMVKEMGLEHFFMQIVQSKNIIFLIFRYIGEWENNIK